MIRIIPVLIYLIIFVSPTNCFADFSYSIKNPEAADAQTYIIEKSNVSLKTEGDFTYWHPTIGAETKATSSPGIIIYHFPLSEPIAEASLIANATTFHWSYSQGHAFIYVSTDGNTWIQVAEATPPDYGKYNAGNASGLLPAVFTGKKDIYVKAELYSYGSGASNGGSLTNTAQYLRYSSSQDTLTLKLDVKYDTGTPAPDSTPLTATVEGRNVTLDWSLMPDAKSYSLYYALTDFKGDIDAASLGVLEMGLKKNISIPNLPSGLILYTAILALTDQGDILSNLVKFMPFGGSANYPQTGNVLMQLDDQGGIGTIEIMGTRNDDGSDNLISKITRTDNTGLHVLYLIDNKPTSYEGNDFTLNFKYGADGSVGYEVVDNSNTIANKTSTNTICSQYKTVDDYLSARDYSIMDSVEDRLEDQKYRIGPTMRTLDTVFIVLLEKAAQSDYYKDYMGKNPSANKLTFLKTDPKFYKLQQILNMMKLISLSIRSYSEIYKEVQQNYSDYYTEQCSGTTPPDDTPVSSCPGIYDSSQDSNTDGVTNGYWVNKSKCIYGFSLKPFYLRGEYPYVNGELNGLVKKYITSGPAAGKIQSKQEYAEGVKVGYTSSYTYDESGQLIGCTLWSNGVSKGSCSQ